MTFDSGYKIRDQEDIHFLTLTVVQWVDVFTRSMYSDIVVESLRHCQKEKGLKIYAWCLMSNHLHLVCSASGTVSLSDILRDFKKFTSKAIVKAIENNNRESRKNWMLWIFRKTGEQNNRNKNHQFWQQDNHPIQCDTYEILKTRITYTNENPVKAGLVRFAGDYIYSSGIDYYCNEKGLLEIEFVR